MTDKTDSKERADFEAWYIASTRESLPSAGDGWSDDQIRDSFMGAGTNGKYRASGAQIAWEGWQARASLAANAGSEPVAWPKDAADVREFVGSHFRSLFYANPTGMDPHENDVYELTAHDLLSAFRWWADLHPSPPEGMVGGWIALPGTLPEPGVPVLLDIGKKYPIRAMWAAKHTVEAADDDTDWGEYDEATDTYYCPEGWYEWNECEETHWAVSATPRAWAPLPPTSSADSRKGE
jgi:hypothetical protein